MSRKAFVLLAALIAMPAVAELRYDIGSPTVRDVYVDPVAGNDNNSGDSRGAALRTLTEAWNRIPSGRTLTANGYRIQLMAGRYDESALPNYLESRYGTAQFPIIIQSA